MKIKKWLYIFLKISQNFTKVVERDFFLQLPLPKIKEIKLFFCFVSNPLISYLLFRTVPNNYFQVYRQSNLHNNFVIISVGVRKYSIEQYWFFQNQYETCLHSSYFIENVIHLYLVACKLHLKIILLHSVKCKWL